MEVSYRKLDQVCTFTKSKLKILNTFKNNRKINYNKYENLLTF